MPQYQFHVQEDDRFIEDDQGQEFDREDAVRKEAVATATSIARDAFVNGSARKVTVHVNRDGSPFITVSITLDVDDDPRPREARTGR